MDLVVYQAGVAALCAGITEALKKAGMGSKYASLSSLIIGLVLGGLISLLDANIAPLVGILGGLMAGLGASGAYSGVKKQLG